ncbi:MAG: BamA/TamA family outer membrane protein, partial [Gemmatimonadaceae bacterium]
MKFRVWVLIAVVGFCADRSVADAQATSRDSLAANSKGRVVVTPGARYAAGWLRRAILGDDYRDLWTTPIEVEVLDLRTFGGGLRPTQRGGSAQTNSLRFAAGDGREYVFRPIEKDFTKWLPPELRESLVKDIVQDQVAGYHPAASLVVARLLDETGIHHPRPRLMVMPNDTLLGEFRGDFAGVLGAIEERPGTYFDDSPESSGATDVISTERLFERLRRNSTNVVDARAFLAARLFDILVGDRDRHRDQWRWARFSATPHAEWEPVPRDRDMPFAKFEGLGPWSIRGLFPQMVSFGPEYSDMVWLNWNAREIDRRLLVGLERSVWDSVTRALQAQMSDAVLDSAISQMPPAFAQLNGAELKQTLIERRIRLPEAAEAYYRILAKEVDLNLTDDRDLVDITRGDDGSVLVSVSAQSGSAGGAAEPDVTYFRRRFQPPDTRDVRLYLHGGADRVVVRGAPRREILLRIIGGDGNDTVLDSVPNGDRSLRFYDSAGDDAFISARATSIDRRLYVAPQVRPQDPVRDWGTWAYTLRGASFSSGRGLMASISHTRNGYGFRSNPFSTRSTVGLDFSLAERRPRLTYSGEFRSPAPNRWLDLELLASGIELIRFHGLGNETSSERETEFYRVFQNLFRIEPEWVMRIAPHATMSLGAVGQFTSTRDDARTLVGETNPYGSNEFGQLGAQVELAVDRRDVANFPTKGFQVAAGGSLHPPLWSVSSTFGDAHMEASGYATAKGKFGPTLALRAGARHVWGRFPFHDAAFLGGQSTLRGWDEQRFAGRSAVS